MELTADQITYCMECGVCTGSCPVNRNYDSFSPRIMIKRILVDQPELTVEKEDLWRCITCGRCSVRCPAMIDFPSFVKHYRKEARDKGLKPNPSHHEILQTIVRLQLSSYHQNRNSWLIEKDIAPKQGEYFYFVGCLPYFNVVFRYLGLKPIEIARSFLSILKSIGINPVISEKEVCCGHDMFWTGDEATFTALAKRNIELVMASQAKTVIFTCPEGYMMFKREYPRVWGGDLPFQVIYASEFLADRLDILVPLLNKAEEEEKVTFHDPCRLGRFEGIYDSPRALIRAVSGTILEMERNRENSLCCGTSAWIECSQCSKSIQIERLRETFQAVGNGESPPALITACPKCQIHLTCAQRGLEEEDPLKNINIEDIYTYLVKHFVRT